MIVRHHHVTRNENERQHMNIPSEHLPLAILLTVAVIALVVSRLWLQSYRHAAQARFRLLSICLPVLVLVLVGLSFTLRSEPRTWIGLGLLFLTIVLVERTRARVGKQVSNPDHHDT